MLVKEVIRPENACCSPRHTRQSAEEKKRRVFSCQSRPGRDLRSTTVVELRFLVFSAKRREIPHIRRPTRRESDGEEEIGLLRSE